MKKGNYFVYVIYFDLFVKSHARVFCIKFYFYCREIPQALPRKLVVNTIYRKGDLQ